MYHDCNIDELANMLTFDVFDIKNNYSYHIICLHKYSVKIILKMCLSTHILA